jgi:hypothetical protein
MKGRHGLEAAGGILSGGKEFSLALRDYIPFLWEVDSNWQRTEYTQL